MNRRAPTEVQRLAVERDLDNIIMSVGTDAEIAADHGVSPAFVRTIRAERARALRTADVEQRLRAIAQLIAWTGTRHALLLRVLDGALARAKQRAVTEAVELGPQRRAAGERA
jgi:hypothetical protein